jgi:hypothetical protein
LEAGLEMPPNADHDPNATKPALDGAPPLAHTAIGDLAREITHEDIDRADDFTVFAGLSFRW